MPCRTGVRSISGEDRYPARLRDGGLRGHCTRFVCVLVLFLVPDSVIFSEETQQGSTSAAADSAIVLEAFDYPEQIGQFPDTWEGRSGWRRVKKGLYYTIEEEEGNTYLHAETTGMAIDAGRSADVNLRIYNRLRWRWRVTSLPMGGNEEIEEKNDSGAGVRLVFLGGIIPKTLKYVWSASLPVGTETVSPTNDRTRVIVLKRGMRNAGKWVWEEVNAYEDYKRVFGGEPRPVKSIAVITDSDNTNTYVEADYDDFLFLKSPERAPTEEREETHQDSLETLP